MAGSAPVKELVESAILTLTEQYNPPSLYQPHEETVAFSPTLLLNRQPVRTEVSTSLQAKRVCA